MTVWGRSANDVFFFSIDGRVIRWDGITFTVEQTGFSPNAGVSKGWGNDGGMWQVGGAYGASVTFKR